MFWHQTGSRGLLFPWKSVSCKWNMKSKVDKSCLQKACLPDPKNWINMPGSAALLQEGPTLLCCAATVRGRLERELYGDPGDLREVLSAAAISWNHMGT